MEKRFSPRIFLLIEPPIDGDIGVTSLPKEFRKLLSTADGIKLWQQGKSERAGGSFIACWKNTIC
jgi:hypothetical protein